jgi:hypothetical protein
MPDDNRLTNEPVDLKFLSGIDTPGLQLSLQLQNNQARPAQVQRADFIKIEKNLASLGFFTPSHKRISGVTQKVIALSREVNGRRVEARATILPSAQYGLPTTADQDTYLAIVKLATDMHRKYGKVTNPIGFTSAELLRIQGKSCVSGYHYKELHEQLMRIKTATILSEGAVYFAGRKVWAKDAFNVITRLVLLGTEMEDGKTADRHYVWFSDWQLENINNNYLLPIDYEAYKQLKNHTAKILVPLLQIWLYASRDAGCFEKRYEEFCQFLNIRVYEHPSKIKEKLGPSLDELKTHGYLSNWQVERTSDGAGYKIILYHGEKFHRDLQARTARRLESRHGLKEKEGCGPDASHTLRVVDDQLLKAMTERGILVEVARELMVNAAENQEVMDQLDWGDYLISQSSGGKFRNPPGFYVYLVRANVTPPHHFETSRGRRLREEAEKARLRAVQERAELELAYMEYERQAVDSYIAANCSNESYSQAIEAKKRELRGNYKNAAFLTEEQRTELAVSCFRKDIASSVHITSFESFCDAKKAGNIERGR